MTTTTEISTQVFAPEQEEPGAVFNDLNAQMSALERFGDLIAKSGFNGCTKVEQGVIIAFTCMAERITPLVFAQKYDIIHGRPTKKAAVMLAEFRQKYNGDYTWIKDGEDGKVATLEVVHKGKKRSHVSFSIEEAERLGLLNKDNWKKQPSAMLRARCTTKCLRMHVPEIAAGIYDPHELSDSIEPDQTRPQLDGVGTGHITPIEPQGESYQAQFSSLVKERSDIEQECIAKFIEANWPKGMNLETIKKAVTNFDTFLTSALKSGGIA